MNTHNVYAINTNEGKDDRLLQRPQGNAFDRTLAHLNMNVFRQLLRLGTSRERMCAVMNLSNQEYDYICGIA